MDSDDGTVGARCRDTFPNYPRRDELTRFVGAFGSTHMRQGNLKGCSASASLSGCIFASGKPEASGGVKDPRAGRIALKPTKDL